MNPKISRADLQSIDRLLDGELAPEIAAALQQRLQGEPRLRLVLQERERVRRGFQQGRAKNLAPPADFAASVVMAARRLPTLEPESLAQTARLCRRILYAAAAVFALAMVWQSGLLRPRGDGMLQAAPDEVQRVIEDLDRRVAARSGGAPK